MKFTYLDNDVGRNIAQAYVTAFFASEFLEDAAGVAYLDTATPADIVTIAHRP